MNVTGFDAYKKQQKNFSNHAVKEFSQPAFEGMNAGHERHISENQRYKNDEMITVREEILPWCAETMALQICVAQSASNQNRKIDLRPF